IAPPAPFGVDSFVIEATRSQHLAWQYPLHPGDRAWVGVRRLHALPHPGLNLLIASDGHAASEAALALGGAIAKVSHARVTLLLHGQHGQQGPDTAQPALTHAQGLIGAGLAALDARSTPDGAVDSIRAETVRQH